MKTKPYPEAVFSASFLLKRSNSEYKVEQPEIGETILSFTANCKGSNGALRIFLHLQENFFDISQVQVLNVTQGWNFSL